MEEHVDVTKKREKYISLLSDDFIENDSDDIDDDDDASSTSSGMSACSLMSTMSGQGWKPMAKHMVWVQKLIRSGVNPRELISKINPHALLSPNIEDIDIWRIIANALSEPPRRTKLSYINTIDDVLRLLKVSKNIIVLTGAGVSVSCGIPDFRSRDGIYSRLAIDFPDLQDPQSMFDINYFLRDPRPFFKFAREIYPGQFIPSPCHKFLKLLEQKGKLLRNYSQNIDTLEKVAGIEKVIECHGSFATASCTKCKYKVNAEDIKADIFAQKIPLCKICNVTTNDEEQVEDNFDGFNQGITEKGIMKPDIVFFGEGLPDSFHEAMTTDKDKCDLLIVIGSSLKVRPVALIPSSILPNVPQILINRESLNHMEFDVELLGDADIIINQLCHL